MKRTYQQPKWAQLFSEFWHKFCNSCRALFDALWNIGGSIAVGGSYVAEKIFAVTGNALDPVIAANLFIGAASLVVMWGLYSWWWVGVTLLGYLGSPQTVGGCLGLVAGILLNIAEILPEVGTLFKEYADVLAAAGKESEARNWDKAGVTAQNFLGYSYSKLQFFRNTSFIAELTASAVYQFMVGGFTKTVVLKGVPVIQALPFGAMMGSIAWCVALVKLPETAIKAAAAAVHVAAALPRR